MTLVTTRDDADGERRPMRMPCMGEKPWRAEWRAILVWARRERVTCDMIGGLVGG